MTLQALRGAFGEQVVERFGSDAQHDADGKEGDRRERDCALHLLANRLLSGSRSHVYGPALGEVRPLVLPIVITGGGEQEPVGGLVSDGANGHGAEPVVGVYDLDLVRLCMVEQAADAGDARFVPVLRLRPRKVPGRALACRLGRLPVDVRRTQRNGRMVRRQNGSQRRALSAHGLGLLDRSLVHAAGKEQGQQEKASHVGNGARARLGAQLTGRSGGG